MTEISAKRLDGWTNTLAGFGGPSDKSRANAYTAADIIDAERLAAIYDGEWLARRVVNAIPEQAFQRGFRLVTDRDDTAARFEALNHTNEHPSGIVLEAVQHGRLFGGAAIFLGVKSGKALTEPLPDVADLVFLDVFDRAHLKPVSLYTDPALGNFGHAEIFEIVGTHPRKGLRIHESRLILCEGLNAVSDAAKSVKGLPAWVSVLQPVWDVLADYGITWRGVSILLQEASIGKLRMKGVIDMLAQESQAAITARLELLSQARSLARTVLLDADGGEDFTREAVSFADLPALLQQVSIRVSGAAETPATILFGQAPSGLNATGDGEIRQFYDRLAKYQRISLTPKIGRILRLIDPGASVEWAPLWQPTEAETEQTRSTRASADRTWYDLGALEPSEIKAARIKDGSFGLDIIPEAKEVETSSAIQLAPTDIARIVTVNESRLSIGLGPLMLPGTSTEDPDGYLTISEFDAKRAAKAETIGAAEGKAEDEPAPDEADEPAPGDAPDEPKPDA